MAANKPITVCPDDCSFDWADFHKKLDMALAHYIEETAALLSKDTIMQFVEYSYQKKVLQGDKVSPPDDLMRRMMAELAQDGRPVGHMQCNNCGYTEVYHPTDVTAEEFQNDGKVTIMKVKQHFADNGWQTSWGYDLCPECARGKSQQ